MKLTVRSPLVAACIAGALPFVALSSGGLAGSVLALGMSGCESPTEPKAPSQARPRSKSSATTSADTSAALTASQERSVRVDPLSRGDFNRLASELALPLFWTADSNKNGAIDPDELAVYWGLVADVTLGDYVAKGGFTTRAIEAIERVKSEGNAIPSRDQAPPELARRAAIKKELSQARITLVETDLSRATANEKRFVELITHAAELVERLYAKQLGTLDLRAKVAPGDTASTFAFFRNQSPKCVAPQTQSSEVCTAVAEAPKGKLSGLYPASLLEKPKFCDEISAAGKTDPAIVDPFSVVTFADAKARTFKAVPYHEAFATDVAAISKDLTAAAVALGETESALKAYLRAAATAFLDDQWWPSDEAWAKMDAKNSKFYLRIGPDEMYREPCASKAMYHVSFGLINQGSLEWQTKLDPLKSEMEKALAELAGAPYKARQVSFKIPDFVDIAINAGDSRPPDGATIGQSLPNFGPVANEGRGRTAAMVNFYTDPDSVEALRGTTMSLFCKDSMAHYTTSREPLLMSTVLHEAAHNLGPAHQYKTNGKDDRATFGGSLAATLEELKAQTAALYFTKWLANKNQITTEQADRAHISDVVWSFGHLSRGMYDEEQKPKNYSQLAAIQLGWLMQKGAIAWHPDEAAANGKDKGCFALALEKFGPAIKTLMTEVAQIKGRGDRARAEQLVRNFVDVTGDKKKLHEIITERVLRSPKPSFVYAIKFD